MYFNGISSLITANTLTFKFKIMGKEHNFYTLGVLRYSLFDTKVVGVVINGDLMPHTEGDKEIESFVEKVIELGKSADMNKVRQQ